MEGAFVIPSCRPAHSFAENTGSIPNSQCARFNSTAYVNVMIKPTSKHDKDGSIHRGTFIGKKRDVAQGR